MKEFLRQAFSDNDGQGSNKRVLTLGVFVLIAGISIGVIFFGAKLNEVIWDNLCYTFWFCIGAITSEKFAPKNRNIG